MSCGRSHGPLPSSPLNPKRAACQRADMEGLNPERMDDDEEEASSSSAAGPPVRLPAFPPDNRPREDESLGFTSEARAPATSMPRSDTPLPKQVPILWSCSTPFARPRVHCSGHLLPPLAAPMAAAEGGVRVSAS